jgi:predicted DNA-binding transcriptional regulator AlpA
VTAAASPLVRYLSRASLAAALDIAESTIDDFVKRGILPEPYELSTGCVRWSWQEVQDAIASRKRRGETPPGDPYMAGAANVTKIPEGRRRAS